MENWTDEHSRLVSQASPPVASMDLDQTWVALRRRIVETPASRGPRRIRMMVGAGVAAAALGFSGVAAAEILSARTGEFPADAENLRLGGPGESLDPSGTDFRDVIDEETADISFPTFAAREVSIDSHVQDLQRGRNPALVTTGAIRGWTAEHAVCSWSNEWVRARRANDTTAEAEAARMLLGASRWSAITALDSEQRNETRTIDELDAKTGEITTETFRDPTQFYYLRLVSQAVSEGDSKALATILARDAYCIGPSLMPDFTQALPPFLRGR